MGRSREYIAARYDRGTCERLDSLGAYVASEVLPGRVSAEDVTRSEVLRLLVDFGLDVFERRAQAWEAEHAVRSRATPPS